jgi:DNA-binding ferritin-like protein
MTTVEQLTRVFNENFVAYFKSHVSHVNVEGRNFTSDHALLGGIYESLQSQIDTIGELLRSLEAYMPNSIFEIIDNCHISLAPVDGDADALLEAVLEDLEYLKECYIALDVVADDEGHEEIANYAQDRILAIAKQVWMLKSTLS